MQDKKRDINARSYEFSINLIKFLRTVPKDNFTAPFLNQLLRCGTSIGANIAEAKGTNTKKDFAKFYDIALKSAHETIYWLNLFRDGLKISSSEIAILIQETDELSRMIGASVLTMRNKR